MTKLTISLNAQAKIKEGDVVAYLTVRKTYRAVHVRKIKLNRYNGEETVEFDPCPRDYIMCRNSEDVIRFPESADLREGKEYKFDQIMRFKPTSLPDSCKPVITVLTRPADPKLVKLLKAVIDWVTIDADESSTLAAFKWPAFPDSCRGKPGAMLYRGVVLDTKMRKEFDTTGKITYFPLKRPESWTYNKEQAKIFASPKSTSGLGVIFSYTPTSNEVIVDITKFSELCSAEWKSRTIQKYVEELPMGDADHDLIQEEAEVILNNIAGHPRIFQIVTP